MRTSRKPPEGFNKRKLTELNALWEAEEDAGSHKVTTAAHRREDEGTHQVGLADGEEQR